MFLYRPIHPIPPDEDVRGDEDLCAHRVRLSPCCNAFDKCEDIVLHMALHSTTDSLTVEQERELRDNLSNSIRKKRGVFKKWDQRCVVFGKSQYATAAAVATGLKCGDVVNDPVVLDLVSHQCLAHITLYGRNTTWSMMLGNADFVPMKLARMSNGVLHPVQNCETIGVMPAKNVPCCTVASSDGACQASSSKDSEMDAVSVVCGVLDDMIDRVVSQKQVTGEIVSGLLDEVLDAVVSQSDCTSQVEPVGRVLRSASRKTSIAPLVSDVEWRDDRHDGKRVLRTRKRKMGTSQSLGATSKECVSVNVTPAKKMGTSQSLGVTSKECVSVNVTPAKKMGTSQSLGATSKECVSVNVMPAKVGGSLIGDLMAAFQEHFSDVNVTTADAEEPLMQLRSLPKCDAKPDAAHSA